VLQRKSGEPGLDQAMFLLFQFALVAGVGPNLASRFATNQVVT
jgi:hypothetical protein